MGRKSKASAKFFQPGASAGIDAAEEMSIPGTAAAGATGKASQKRGAACTYAKDQLSSRMAGVCLPRLSKEVVMLPAWAPQGALLRPRQLYRYCRAPCQCQARFTTPRCEQHLVMHWPLHKCFPRTRCATCLSSKQNCSEVRKRRCA